MLEEIERRKALMSIGAKIAKAFMQAENSDSLKESGLYNAVTLIAQELAGGPDHPETGVYVSKLMDAGEALLMEAKDV